MSHSAIHHTVAGKVNIGQSLLLSVIPIGVNLSFCVSKDLFDLCEISFSFCGNLIWLKPELQKSSSYPAEILDHIWQVFKAASFFGFAYLRIVRYSNEDTQLLFWFSVTNIFFKQLALLDRLNHIRYDFNNKIPNIIKTNTIF